MMVARNVELENDYPKEFPVDPFNYIVSNRCVRITEDRTIYSNMGQISEQ